VLLTLQVKVYVAASVLLKTSFAIVRPAAFKVEDKVAVEGEFVQAKVGVGVVMFVTHVKLIAAHLSVDVVVESYVILTQSKSVT